MIKHGLLSLSRSISPFPFSIHLSAAIRIPSKSVFPLSLFKLTTRPFLLVMTDKRGLLNIYHINYEIKGHISSPWSSLLSFSFDLHAFNIQRVAPAVPRPAPGPVPAAVRTSPGYDEVSPPAPAPVPAPAAPKDDPKVHDEEFFVCFSWVQHESSFGFEYSACPPSVKFDQFSGLAHALLNG